MPNSIWALKIESYSETHYDTKTEISLPGKHRLLLLVDGNIVYLGDASKAVSYYEDLGFIYPADMNPADYLSVLA